MLNIKVLGPDCYNCHLLEQQTVVTLESLAEELPEDPDITIVKVTEYEDIMKYPSCLPLAWSLTRSWSAPGASPRLMKSRPG